MARRGRFGRRPGTGGTNMSQLVAALIREYRQARDKAIFDAYQNGGEFEGKPVTDQALLDYIRQRRDMFSKDDPLWDQWNNTLIQQQFTIGESKSSLAYQQAVAKAKEAWATATANLPSPGTTEASRAAYDAAARAASIAYNSALAAAAGDVASFYKTALGSATPDSQFYREIAGKLAEWQANAAEAQKAVESATNAASGGGGGSGGPSAAKSKTAIDDLLQAARVQQYYAEEAIRAALARAGYSLSDKQSIYDVGADVILALFNSGAIGFPIEAWTKVNSDLNDLITQAIPIYQAAHADWLGLVKLQTDIQKTIITTGSLDAVSNAEMVYRRLQSSLTAANGDPSLIAKAYADAKVAIGDLLSAATKNGADADLISALKNDYTALSGGTPRGFGLIDLINEANVSSGQQPLTFAIPDDGVASGAAQIAADLAQTRVNQQLLSSGQGYFVQSANGSLTVVDSKDQPPGALDPAYQQTAIVSGGQPVAAYLNGTPIYSTQLVDAKGNPILDKQGNPIDPRLAVAGGQASETLIGYHYTYTLNGRETEAWGIIGANGQITFTTKNPWLGLASTVRDADGNVTRINVSTRTSTGDVIEPGATIPSVVATATPSLVIDPAVTPLLRNDPTKAAELVKTGVVSIDTFATALTGSSAFITANPSATTDDVLAWMATQQATSQSAGYLAQRAGERGTDTGGAPTPATATSLLSQQQYPGNLLQQRIYDALGLVAQNIINPLGTDRVTAPEAPPTYKGTDADFGPIASPTVSPYTGFTVAQPIATTAPAPTAPTGGTLVGGTVIYPSAPAPAPAPSGTLVGGTIIYPTTSTATISQPVATTKTYSGGYSAI